MTQDVLVTALALGFEDWPSPSRRAWLRGVVHKRAALFVRGETRRRRREQLPEGAAPAAGPWVWRSTFLDSLPRSLRVVAALAGADLGAGEIRWLLGLSDTALRQRLSMLRRQVQAQPEPPTQPASPARFAFGAQRASLLASLRQRGGRAIAAHDPDGHPLFLCFVAHETGLPGNP